MSEQIVVLIGHPEADEPVRACLDLLADLAAEGLLRPFWFVPLSDQTLTNVTAELIEHDSRAEVALFPSLAGRAAPSVTRVVAVATAALDERGIAELQQFADDLTSELRRRQPTAAPFHGGRLVFPISLVEPTPLVNLFAPHHDANLVAIPEDRSADTAFSAPVTLHHGDEFAGHVAAEVATQCGLWSGVESASMDRSTPGVVDGASPKVVLVRSFARAALAEPLPLFEAMQTGDALPVPPGITRSPAPVASALELADRLFEDNELFTLREPEPFASDREKHSVRDTARILGREAGRYLRELPRQLAAGFRADVEQTSGEALNTYLGDEARVEAVWAEKGLGEGADDELLSVVADGLRRRSRAVEAPPIDQTEWSRLVTDIAGAVDASPKSLTTLHAADHDDPMRAGSQRLVIAEPRHVGPAPRGSVEETVDALLDEPISPSAGTVLGRLAARIRANLDRASARLEEEIAAVEEAAESLRTSEARSLPWLTWPIGALLTIALTALVLGVGAPTWIGSESWSPEVRTAIGGVIAIISMAGAALCVAAAMRGAASWAKPVPWVVSGVIVVATGAWWWEFTNTDTPPGPWLETPARELTLIGGVIALLVTAVVTCALQKSPAARTATRVAGIVLLAYLSLTTMGVLTGENGWYSQQDSGEVLRQCLRLCVGAVLAALLLFLPILYIRVRERLSLSEARRRLYWSIAAARELAHEVVRLRCVLQQYLGTAASLCALVHLPFGRAGADGTASGARFDRFPAEKLSIHRYHLTEKGRVGALARIRRVIAEPGWLNGQYGAASATFVPEFAFLSGRDPEEIDRLRPETDQTVEDPEAEVGSVGAGPRWRFAELFVSGAFDRALADVAIEKVIREALDRYLEHLDGDNGVGVAGLGGALMEGTPSPVPSEVLIGLGLVTADDARTRFTSTLWWPRALGTPSLRPDTELQGTTVIETPSQQIAVEFVRSDWSIELPLSMLPLAAPTSKEPKAHLGPSAEVM